MDESIIGLFVCIGVAILLCVFIGALLLIPINLGASHSCAAKAERLGLEYDYSLFQGCFVKDNGKWIDYSNYRVVFPHE